MLEDLGKRPPCFTHMHQTSPNSRGLIQRMVSHSAAGARHQSPREEKRPCAKRAEISRSSKRRSVTSRQSRRNVNGSDTLVSFLC